MAQRAATADRFELYQIAVQSPESDLAFLRRVRRRRSRREARHLREDFCGTAFLCATWARREGCTAEGFDLDPEPLAWGAVHNLEPLGSRAARVSLHQKDVRARSHVRPDIRVAQNFSYWVFRERRELLEYFRAARADLAPGGMFAIDVYGGPDATEEVEDARRVEGKFTYVWEQARHLPGSGDYTCHIHFRFRDGSEMRRAFTYHWRFWSLPELRDLLREAGFRKVEAWFEGADRRGNGNGRFRLDDEGRSASDCAAWVAYLVAFP
jgi:SAM-dependent methyltransferase